MPSSPTRGLQERLSAAAERVASPVALVVGVDAAVALLAEAARPLVVITTERARRDPIAGVMLAGVSDDEIWPHATAHPGPDLIERAAAAIEHRAPQTVVGLGGGSVLDLTKIANASTTVHPPPCLIQIPTTAGTGAEVTRWGTYWLPDGTKQSFDEPAGFADHALVVPELTESMPPRLTLATGLDAFVHAAESIVGRHAEPASTAVAVSAIELVRDHLTPAVQAPDPPCRAAMIEAATLGGLALSVTRSAAAHALSYSLTGVYGLEHGLAVGLMWRALAPELEVQNPEPMGLVLDAMGVASAEDAVARIDQWFATAGLQPSLASLGLPDRAADDAVEQALRSNRLDNQPGTWGRAELEAAFARVR